MIERVHVLAVVVVVVLFVFLLFPFLPSFSFTFRPDIN